MLESAVHVSSQVHHLQHVPRSHVQNNIDLHKTYKDGSRDAITSIGRRCSQFCLRSLPICALHCEAARWHSVRQRTKTQRQSKGQNRILMWRLPDLVTEPEEFAESYRSLHWPVDGQRVVGNKWAEILVSGVPRSVIRFTHGLCPEFARSCLLHRIC